MGKKQGRRGRWEGGYLFPLPVVPRALSFSPLPATNRGLCREEKDTELKHVVHTILTPYCYMKTPKNSCFAGQTVCTSI